MANPRTGLLAIGSGSRIITGGPQTRQSVEDKRLVNLNRAFICSIAASHGGELDAIPILLFAYPVLLDVCQKTGGSRLTERISLASRIGLWQVGTR